MSTNTQAPGGSGDGTRPMTSGGADNIGGGERLTGHRTAAGEQTSAPAARERMRDKAQDAESVQQDDSAPWGLTDAVPTPGNSEPRPSPGDFPLNQPGKDSGA